MFWGNQRLNKMIKKIFISMLFLMPNLIFAQANPKEKTADMSTDFSRIKEVLKNDQLEGEAKKKLEKQKELKALEEKESRERFNIPKENEFWSFMTEYWIVKNMEKLKWNFEKPDYGLEEYFSKFLEEQGYYEVNFKILLLDNALVPHFCLPSNPNEAIFLISVPFMRTLDLSKLEISLLLLEDYVRNKLNQFKGKVSPAELDKIFGLNFQKQEFPQKMFDEILKRYDEVVYDKGFNFEEQFELTIKMEKMLKSNAPLWTGYLGLIEKIGVLAKTNTMYKDYAKLYPSPEMQLNWLKPKKKVL
jgi:hypothetical protein